MPEEFDVVILGGGINGCGTFCDLCLQGLRVLLLERDDFCAGASGASSRLMHGGLKYLETGEFGLVRESLTERNMLFLTAPHYVRPLQVVLPVRSLFGGFVTSALRFLGGKGKLTDRGFLISALGLTVYDLYARARRALPNHHMLTKRALRRIMPNLPPAIIGAAVYYEGQITHAERLGLELVLDGEAAMPDSRAVTHAEVLRADADVIHYRAAGQDHQARAKVIINAGGAWIDKVNARLGIDSHLMGGSRGAHLVVDSPDLLHALGGRMVYFGTADGRVNLLYPFFGKVLIGATDIAQPDPDLAICTEAEEDYLLGSVAEVFPDIPIRRDQIAYRYTGVRPLPASTGAIGGVSRDHSIAALSLPGTLVPVLCLIGGKWTTFRSFSEQAADAVLAHLGATRRTSTAGLAIGGGKGFPRDAQARAALVAVYARLGGLTLARADALLARYGTRAREYCASLRGGGEVMLTAQPDYARAEIRHLARTERALTVDDILRRRTLIALTGGDTPTLRTEVAALLAELNKQTEHLLFVLDKKSTISIPIPSAGLVPTRAGDA